MAGLGSDVFVGESLSAATTNLNNLAESINDRERSLRAGERRLMSLSQEEAVRSKQLATYSAQLYAESQSVRDENVVFCRRISEKEREIQNRVCEANNLYESYIKNLGNIENRKSVLQKEISALSKNIERSENAQKSLDDRSFAAEEVLFEYVTRPFNRYDIEREVQDSYIRDRCAISSLLDLNLQLIHDLRSRLSDEKESMKHFSAEIERQISTSQRDLDKSRCDTLILIEDRDRLHKSVNSKNRLSKRMDKEHMSIIHSIGAVKSTLLTKSTSIDSMKNETKTLLHRIMGLQSSFNPAYHGVLHADLARVRDDASRVNEHLRKRTKKLSDLGDREICLRDLRNRLLSEISEIDDATLQLRVTANEQKRLQLDYDRRECDEAFRESSLISELSDLERKISILSSEFETMISSHADNTYRKEPEKMEYKDSLSVKQLAKKVSNTIASNMETLALIRTVRERNDFTTREIRRLQSELHLSLHNIEKMKCRTLKRLESGQCCVRSPFGTVNELKHRIALQHEKNNARRERIIRKADILKRIESVHGVSGQLTPFVLEDSEKIIDRFDRRQALIEASAARVASLDSLIGAFRSLHIRLMQEKSRWNRLPDARYCVPNMDSDYLYEWTNGLRDICHSFRSFGI